MLLEERHRRRADLDAEVAARDHDCVRLDDDRLERLDRLGLLDLRDHVRRRALRLDAAAQVADVVGRADERERDEVDSELEREGEVVDVLGRQGRDRQRDAGQVDALVRLDAAADHDRADGPQALDALDAKPDVPVVDEDVVAGPRAPRRSRTG